MKDFFQKLNALGKPKRTDIIEKDYHLQRLLYHISQKDYLRDNLVFKGGTCLIKAYNGYYRFSEDIDFTWQNKDIWEGKSKTETVRGCSKEITKLIDNFKDISDGLGLIFSGEKSNSSEVHISSGGRMVLFFIGYNSEVLNLESRIKIEINFMERTLYPFKRKKLKSYAENLESEELKFLYEELWKEYSAPISLICYDSREIFLEKCRASMTRRSYKLRDVLDIYFMESGNNCSISSYKQAIKKKTKFMLNTYERYRENIESMIFPSTKILSSEEMKLMLVPPPKDLERNLKRIHEQLDVLRNELLSEL